MKFYLIKYRVTTANNISNTVETYDTIEEVESQYYSNVSESITNNKLKYVMLSILDSEGNNIKHISNNSPGEVKALNKYYLIEHYLKTNNIVEDVFNTYSSLDDAKNKLKEDQNVAIEDDTISTLQSIIVDTKGLIKITEAINGGGYLDYKNKYLLFVNKTKNDGTFETTITRYDDKKVAEAYAYKLISNSINDETLFYIDCRIEDTTGNNLLHERKSCKGRIPVEEEVI